MNILSVSFELHMTVWFLVPFRHHPVVSHSTFGIGLQLRNADLKFHHPLQIGIQQVEMTAVTARDHTTPEELHVRFDETHFGSGHHTFCCVVVMACEVHWAHFFCHWCSGFAWLVINDLVDSLPDGFVGFFGQRLNVHQGITSQWVFGGSGRQVGKLKTGGHGWSGDGTREPDSGGRWQKWKPGVARQMKRWNFFGRELIQCTTMKLCTCNNALDFPRVHVKELTVAVSQNPSMSTVFVIRACQCSQVGKRAGWIQTSMGKDVWTKKKEARTDSIGLAGEFTPKKKQVEQQLRVDGESLFHGHKLLVHNPKQCVTIDVRLEEKTLQKALRK